MPVHIEVVPLPKCGPTTDINNYRPISILLILSKVLERFVHINFSKYIKAWKLVTLCQSGRFSVPALFHYSPTTSYREVDKNIDNNLVTGVVYLDVRKSVDTVNTLSF